MKIGGTNTQISESGILATKSIKVTEDVTLYSPAKLMIGSPGIASSGNAGDVLTLVVDYRLEDTRHRLALCRRAFLERKLAAHECTCS